MSTWSRAQLRAAQERDGVLLGQQHFGQLGDGGYDNSVQAVAAKGVNNVTSMALGLRLSCALKVDKSVVCWGTNGHGELGNGTLGKTTIPVQPKGATSVKLLAVGSAHTCTLSTTAKALCWGHNAQGQLGISSQAKAAKPTPSPEFPTPSAVIAIEAGRYHTCALKADKTVSCLGYNNLPSATARRPARRATVVMG